MLLEHECEASPVSCTGPQIVLLLLLLLLFWEDLHILQGKVLAKESGFMGEVLCLLVLMNYSLELPIKINPTSLDFFSGTWLDKGEKQLIQPCHTYSALLL